MPAWKPILLANVNLPNSEKITTYLENGGYRALGKALTMQPEQIIQEVKASGLRGRGGAGFPTGVKWGFMPKDAPVKYLAVNTDEGEPGTFKDRLIVERDPHSILEGVIIAAYAVGIHRAFVYIRGEFFLGVKRWIKAIADAYQYGYLGKNILDSGFDLDVSVHRGAGAYICGEETAMIESLEGKRGRAALEAALSRAGRPMGQTDSRAEYRDPGQHPTHRPAWRRLVRKHRHRAEQGSQDLLCQWARQPAGQLRAAAGHQPARDRSTSTPAACA